MKGLVYRTTMATTTTRATTTGSITTTGSVTTKTFSNNTRSATTIFLRDRHRLLTSVFRVDQRSAEMWSIVLCSAVLCSVQQWSFLGGILVVCNVVWCNLMFYSVLLCSTVLCSLLLYSVVLCNVVWCSLVLCSFVPRKREASSCHCVMTTSLQSKGSELTLRQGNQGRSKLILKAIKVSLAHS